ncbi:dynein regulatory complex subunit 2 [Anableps anableps]
MPRKALTEEERLLQQQQRAQAEGEMAKKKEEMLTLYLKDRLQREQRNTAVNLLKLTESWRKILRQTRDNELLSEASVLQQTSERRLDELNAIIQKMMRELQDAARQADQAQRCHLQYLEELWERQKKHLLVLQQRWESCLLDLSSICGSEKEKMLTDFQQQRQGLVDLFLPAQIHDKAMTEYVQKVQQEVMDFYRNAHPDLDLLRKEVKNQEDGSTLNQKVLQMTRDKLVELDEKLSREQQEINTELRKVKRMKEQAIQLRQLIFSCQADKDLMEQNWTFTRDKINQKCLQVQNQLARDRQEARKKLTELSIQGAAATKSLQAVITKGEKVLQAAELCNKLQDQQEVPLCSSEKDRQELQGVQELLELQQHLNSALLHREALRNHNQGLIQENQQLQVLLDHSDDSLDGHRAPLPVLRVPIGSGPPAADRQHTVIEAAHIVKHCLLDSWS